MRHGDLPEGVVLQRTTDEWDAESLPAGLRRAHRLAPDTWGLLRVLAGTVTFVWEGEPGRPVALAAGDELVIEPEVLHHLEPATGVRLAIAFYR